MRVRPGRLLPSVMVGGLLVSGLALGAGVASGAVGDTCTVGTTTYKILDAEYTKNSAGDCVGPLGLSLTAALLGDVTGKLEKVVAEATTTSKAPVGDGNAAPDATGGGADSGTAAPTTSAKPAAAKSNAPAAAGPAMVAPPPAALPPAAPAALGAAGPVGALPPLAGVAPAGLASNLFSANAYDPGLLFGTPLGNAASALFSPKADSAVTTVSQAQLLPSAGSGGFGTPATIGVIILACLIGFAVRHRVISRMKKRELPAAEYQPRHAAVETEPEPDPATELHAPDEARTLVVLSRR